jgi:phage-related protein
MARRYDLGSVVGEIRFDYDKNGVSRARNDIDRFTKDADDGGDHFDLFSKRSVAAAGKIVKSFALIAGSMAALSGGLSVLNGVVVALAQLSQAAVLLPGLMAGFIASIATVMLGVDGIKKAFEGLKPTLDTLKSQVSNAFERSLVPAVNNLKSILPQLTTGFRNIAIAMGDSASKFTAMLTQSRSIGALNNILNQTAAITRNVGKALAPLGQAFLTIASIGLSFITPMTRGLAGLATEFNAWVQSASGQAQINDMIKTGIQAFKILFGIIGQIGGIITAVFDGLSTSTGSFGQSLVDTLRSVKDFLKSAEGFNALQAIGQTLQEVGTVVRTVLLTALKELAPAIPPLMQAFSQLAQQVMPILVKVLEIVGPIIVKIAQAIADNIQWIGPLIIALGVWAAAQWALNAALDANPIGLVILALAALVAAVALVITNWDTIVAFFKGIWDQVWKWTSDRITDVRNFIVSTWNDIYKWLSDKLTSIRDFFVNIWNDIASFFSGIGTTIGNAVGNVIDWFASLPAKIGAFLSTLPGIVLDYFTAAFKFAVNAVIQGIEWVIAAMLALPVKIAILVIQATKALIDGFVNGFNWLATNIPIFINNVITFFNELPGRVIAAVANFGTMIGTWFTNAWAFLTTTATNLLNAFITWMLTAPAQILGALASFGSMLLNWVSTAFNTAWDWAVARAAEFIAWAVGLPGRIIAAIKRFIEDARNWASQAFQALRDAAAQKAAEFLSWISGLPGRIISYFTGLYGRMLSIGGDIVRGIWQGIQNLASWLWNRVTDFVGGIVDKVQSLLNIGSPSKVFADEVGKWIPAGIAVGVEANAGTFLDSIKTLMNDAMGRFNAMSTMSPDMSGFVATLASTSGTASPQITGNSSSSSNNVTIANLNITGNLDPTNPTQWRQALVNIKDGIREVERQYA